jgi:hypothetical protein
MVCGLWAMRALVLVPAPAWRESILVEKMLPVYALALEQLLKRVSLFELAVVTPTFVSKLN